MAHFTAAQERKAACLLCPRRCISLNGKTKPCKKKDNSCSINWQNSLRKSSKYHKDILVLCHYLFDDDLHYFKIED